MCGCRGFPAGRSSLHVPGASQLRVKAAEEPPLWGHLCHRLGPRACLPFRNPEISASFWAHSLHTGHFAARPFHAAEQLLECLPPGHLFIYLFIYLHQCMLLKPLAGWPGSQLCVGSATACAWLAPKCTFLWPLKLGTSCVWSSTTTTKDC